MVGSFVISGLVGTVIALRLMAIEEKEQSKKSKLTVRGKLVVALSIGLAIATFIVLINGMWWNCDTSTCSFTWGY
jgi:ABC-type amino acid transport system permease subunit